MTATATPTPTRTPTSTPTPSISGIVWANTVQVIAVVNDPNFCVTGQVGQVSHTTFEVQRNGNSVMIVPPDPLSDFPTYTGTVNGVDFTATSPPEDLTGGPCSPEHFSGSLSGRFTQDGNHLTATEVWSYRFDSGAIGSVTFSWTANRL